MEIIFPFDPSVLPGPGDRDRAETGVERLRDAVSGNETLAAFADALIGLPAGRALLDSVFGNSPFLGRCLLREIGTLRLFLAQGPDAAFAATLAALDAASAANDEAAVMAALRRARQKIALITALADIAGLWRLDRVTGALSRFADRAAQIATAHMLRASAARGQISLAHQDDPNRDSGFIVLGMGKLGAHELNYSSDIDLIVLYDPQKVRTTDPAALGQVFVRLTRGFTRMLSERTIDGYVFRTDLRLRPDPSATPLALSVQAAMEYYESTGQNWERAAMVKARPVAGDREAGAEFLARLRPFIWRKHLDFAAIEDIHSIKRQITAHRGGGEIAVNGHNIKLGRGGIREIEFFAQTQQLIWGGRNAALRIPETCAALRGLAAAGRITDDAAMDMIAAYEYLRRVEHRLQMIEDEQTHSLPRTDREIDAVAAFLGHDNGGEFRTVLLGHLAVVERHYAGLFEGAPDLGGGETLVFTGNEDHPETIRNLEEMGFDNGSTVAAIVRGWHHGRYPATRTVRSRQLLTGLVPGLLAALARTAEPSTALIRFDAYLHALPAGIQLFSIFIANPPLIDLVVEIMGNAPRLSQWLRRNPSCLDAVLAADYFETLDTATLRADLDRALGQAGDIEDVLEGTRRWAYEHKFRVGVQILRGVTDGIRAGPALSAIADTAVIALWRAVEAEFIRRHGRVAGGGAALLAMGKLGGGELAHRSDLDLVFIHDYDADAGASDGPKPLVPGLYFNRLAQRLIAGITARTGEGRLYELDMRLRPSGDKGPIAAKLDGFAQYQRESAWTWEQMALTRARIVAAPDWLGRAIEAVIRKSLTRARDALALARDVAQMRTRMIKEHPGKSIWDIKHRRGGLVDIEFIAQYLMLRHAAATPGILSPNTADALTRLTNAGYLDRQDAAALQSTLGLWQRLQGVLRLSAEGAFDGDQATEGQRALLIEAGQAIDFERLIADMKAAAATVMENYQRQIAAPAKISPS